MAVELLDRLKTRDLAHEARFSAGSARRFVMSDAGGAFEMNAVAIGIFLNDVPSHAARFGDGAVEKMPFRAGEGWLLTPGAEGHCEWRGENDYLMVTLAPDAFDAAGLRAATLAPQIQRLDPLVVGLAAQLYDSDAALPRLYRDSLATALVAQVARVARAAEPAGGADLDPRLARAVEYIEAHLAEDIGLDALASVAAMSPFHFNRAFKAALGAPPHQFLLARRLERAKALIETTKLPIVEIAYRVGYSDAARFGKHFKRRFGATPGALRR